MRRIIVLLVSALLLVALAANVALAAPPDNKGACDNDVNVNCAEEDKVKGSPDDPNAWGSVVSQFGIQGVVGEHSSDPPGDEPRDGLGNVARNDGGDEPDSENTGDHLGDHACIADIPSFGTSCAAEPGSTAPGRA